MATPATLSTLATFRNKPVDTRIHAVTRETIGVLTIALCAPEKHVSLPMFLKTQNGNINRYMLFKALIINTETNRANRLLTSAWFIMSANPKMSIGKDGKVYIDNQNQGYFYTHEKYIRANKSLWNMANVKVTPINMGLVPKANFCSTKEKWDNLFDTRNEPEHRFLMLNEYNSSNEETNKKFQAFMENGFAITEKSLAALANAKGVEPNVVFYIEDNTLQPFNGLYYGNANADKLFEANASGITGPATNNSFTGIIKIDTSVNTLTTGNDINLQLGIRQVGENRQAKYGFDRLGTTYDKLNNAVHARLTSIDVMPITYLENAAKDGKVNSRALNLEEAVTTQTPYMEFVDCQLKVHSNAGDANSLAISLEYVLTPKSSYYGIRDTSKLSSVAIANELDDIDDILNMDISLSDEEIDALVNSEATLKTSEDKVNKKREQKEPEADEDLVNSVLDDDLPF